MILKNYEILSLILQVMEEHKIKLLYVVIYKAY